MLEIYTFTNLQIRSCQKLRGFYVCKFIHSQLENNKTSAVVRKKRIQGKQTNEPHHSYLKNALQVCIDK